MFNYDPGQNICREVKKFSKDGKTFVCVYFLTAIAKI